MDSRLQRFERPRMAEKMISEIQRDPVMSAEQGGNWLSDWGGPTAYRYFAKAPRNDRLTYYAISSAGCSTVEDIAAVTDLRTSQVEASIARLQRAGWITNWEG